MPSDATPSAHGPLMQLSVSANICVPLNCARPLKPAGGPARPPTGHPGRGFRPPCPPLVVMAGGVQGCRAQGEAVPQREARAEHELRGRAVVVRRRGGVIGVIVAARVHEGEGRGLLVLALGRGRPRRVVRLREDRLERGRVEDDLEGRAAERARDEALLGRADELEGHRVAIAAGARVGA